MFVAHCLQQVAHKPLEMQTLVILHTLAGVVLCNSNYQLGCKSLAKLVGAQLPSTLKELQGLAGKLNFVG